MRGSIVLAGVAREVTVAALVSACAGNARQTPAPDAKTVSVTAAPALRPGRAMSLAEPANRRLTRAEARRYMVELVNRDRATRGLLPVLLDEGAPSKAGQAHADDMASHGYLGHWGTDGSVPEQRFTEAGGADMVLENASCFTDERTRRLDGRLESGAHIDAKDVEVAEDMFFHEVPPNDGHRRNILKPWHTKVGIGIAQPEATATEIPVPCFTQEFVDGYGTYAALPRRGHVGDPLHIEGTTAAPAAFAGVGLSRVDLPASVAVAEVNRRRSYPVPAPYQTFWPPGFKTTIPVKVNGQHFMVDVPLNDRGKAGLYEVSVWATLPGSADLVMVSLRTIRVTR